MREECHCNSCPHQCSYDVRTSVHRTMTTLGSCHKHTTYHSPHTSNTSHSPLPSHKQHITLTPSFTQATHHTHSFPHTSNTSHSLLPSPSTTSHSHLSLHSSTAHYPPLTATHHTLLPSYTTTHLLLLTPITSYTPLTPRHTHTHSFNYTSLIPLLPTNVTCRSTNTLYSSVRKVWLARPSQGHARGEVEQRDPV